MCRMSFCCVEGSLFVCVFGAQFLVLVISLRACGLTLQQWINCTKPTPAIMQVTKNTPNKHNTFLFYFTLYV